MKWPIIIGRPSLLIQSILWQKFNWVPEFEVHDKCILYTHFTLLLFWSQHLSTFLVHTGELHFLYFFPSIFLYTKNKLLRLTFARRNGSGLGILCSNMEDAQQKIY